MSDISKNTLFIIVIISCYFLATISQIVLAKHSFQQNKTNNLTQIQQAESDVINQTLDYNFFSYNVIDHNTLLVKFDITRTILFQQTQILYDAYLYVSKIPTTNYKINIGPFSGVYEKELDGTITDHFTFCLVLIPTRQQKKINNTLNQNNKTKTIFHKYLRSSYQKQQQHILHYCTKMGPDEDRYHHRKKQGSEGDRVLLLLQIMMIGIFLIIIQIAHISKNQKLKEWRLRQINRLRHELSYHKEFSNPSNNALSMLRFKTINDEDSQNEKDEEEKEDEDEEEGEEEEEEDSITLSHRRLPSPITTRKRSRSPSPNIGRTNDNTNDSSIEHILESKPWLQIPQ